MILALCGIFAVLAANAAGGPGRSRLSRLVGPAEVFTVEVDGASRAHFDPTLEESWFLFVVQADGIASGTIGRSPTRAALLPWTALS